MKQLLTKNKPLVVFGIFFISVILILAISLIWIYALTPRNFISPKIDHFHFRMIYINQGKMENFGEAKYQEAYEPGVCSGGLTKNPIHFHDNRNQLVHLHWQRITGGQVLKYYGLNKIGGLGSYMGIKMDDLLKFKFTLIPIHGKVLPQPGVNDKFWIYTGEKDNFKKRDYREFFDQDLETFFGKDSILRKQKEEVEEQEKKFNFVDLLPKVNVFAHGGDNHSTQNKTGKTEEELKEINNLLGNVVIFVQQNEPTAEEINNKFTKLEPLSDSQCGG